MKNYELKILEYLSNSGSCFLAVCNLNSKILFIRSLYGEVEFTLEGVKTEDLDFKLLKDSSIKLEEFHLEIYDRSKTLIEKSSYYKLSLVKLFKVCGARSLALLCEVDGKEVYFLPSRRKGCFTYNFEKFFDLPVKLPKVLDVVLYTGRVY